MPGVQLRVEKVMDVTISREVERLERRLTFLATVGSTAPFIGLFGTVWGIMTSFQAIAVSKNTSLAVVAPGIAEALFATALGLLAAIPAVIFYNKFNSEVARHAARLEGFADEFAAILSRQIDKTRGAEAWERVCSQAAALASRRARRRSAAPMSEINVTPMVDVMLVLLIIFMVTAPLLTAGIEVVPQPDLPKVELPKTEAPARSMRRSRRLPSPSTRKARSSCKSTEIGFDELVPKLTAIRDAGGGDRVEVRGDDRAQYGSIAKVLARIKSAGIPVTLVTEPIAEKSAQ